MPQLQSKEVTNRSDFLKCIAIVLMLVDHIGYAFFPHILELRMIGRLAFPIFAYYLAQGAMFTSKPGAYAKRLFVFALASQIPFTLLFDTFNLNIMFVFLLSLFLIRQGWYYVGIIAMLSFFIPMDYGFYGVMIAPILVWLKDKKLLALAALTVITVCFCWYWGSWIQMYAMIGFLLVLYVPSTLFKMRINRYFFYLFYPVHLLILLIVKYALM